MVLCFLPLLKKQHFIYRGRYFIGVGLRENPHTFFILK